MIDVKRSVSAGIVLIMLGTGLVVNAQPFKVDATYPARHDIIYNAPFYEGFEGIPLGNGDLGGMMWCTPTGLRMQINKSDAFDRSSGESIGEVLRSCAQLEIDFGAPVMNWLYLNDFTGRLSLLDAKASISSHTPFQRTDIHAYVAANQNVWVIECEKSEVGEVLGKASVEVTLERWGSRTFPGWYGGYSRDAGAGLGKATAHTADSVIYLVERFSDTEIAVSCKVIGMPAQAVKNNNRSVSLSTDGFTNGKLYIVIAVASDQDNPNPLSYCLRTLSAIGDQDIQAIRENHADWWSNFWKRSFVHLPDDYIENIYYFKRYLLASSSRGRYPTLFNGGIFTWNHDVRNWVIPHHWNMQQFYWGILPGGDADLLKPYLDAYTRLVPQAEAHAERRGVAGAILWSEGHTYDGVMQFWDRPDMVNNYTPASQIAKFFWDYFQYTRDQRFLQETAYPFMKKSAEFYLQKLTWSESEQKFRLSPTQPYESPETNDLVNSITDLGMIQFLFEKCITASEVLGVDKDKRTQWRYVLDHLWDAPIDFVKGVGEVYRLGYRTDGSIYPDRDDHGSWLAHFSANTSLVFPASVIGLYNVGTREFAAAARIIDHHPDEKNAITPNAIVAARLGKGDHALRIVTNTIRRLQHFPNGLFYNLDHWYLLSVYADSLKNPSLSAQRDYLYDARSRYVNNGGKSGLPAKPFVQCGLEPLGILGAAVNEMLMQSHESVIRIFPAIPDSWKGKEIAFTLHAEGAFRISARLDSTGQIAPVEIVSNVGGECRLVNPWTDKSVVITRADGASVRSDKRPGGVIAFATSKGERYVVKQSNAEVQSPITFKTVVNNSPKQFHEAMLGIPRNF